MANGAKVYPIDYRWSK